MPVLDLIGDPGPPVVDRDEGYLAVFDKPEEGTMSSQDKGLIQMIVESMKGIPPDKPPSFLFRHLTPEEIEEYHSRVEFNETHDHILNISELQVWVVKRCLVKWEDFPHDFSEESPDYNVVYLELGLIGMMAQKVLEASTPNDD